MPDRAGAPPRVWQRMLSGRRLDLLDPSPLDVELEDIAHGLARVARWNGQTSGDHALSVAQHTLVVETIVRRANPGMSAEGLLATMLHDAPEYVIGDMISPFKALIGGEYRTVEARLLSAIHRRFGLPAILPPGLVQKIKAADMIAAYYEATVLAGFTQSEAIRYFGRPRGIDPKAIALDPWPAQAAEARFRARFEEIAADLARPPAAAVNDAARI
ncbi:MAG TPA: HD family hydrolase [Bauldia sp.]|nr:HD family hydrolase [Bauldia sp.]